MPSFFSPLHRFANPRVDANGKPTTKFVLGYLALLSVVAVAEWWSLQVQGRAEMLGGPIVGAWFVASIAALNYLLRRTPAAWSIAGVAALMSVADLVFCVLVAGNVTRLTVHYLPWSMSSEFRNASELNNVFEYTILLMGMLAIVISARGWFKYSTQARISHEAQLQVERERANMAERNRELVKSELRFLRAQIEPHFLWNTLAHVQHLTKKSPQDAEKMTGFLISYLRSSVAQDSGDMVTLRSDVDSVRAYLELMRIRMGTRMSFKVVLEPGLNEVPFPPRLIHTLVENAVKHGIEPKVGPVMVTVAVAIKPDDKDTLAIEVIDNGVGIQASGPTKGTGMGLTSVRKRLSLIYGDKATLSVYELPQGGTASRIEVPLNPKTTS